MRDPRFWNPEYSLRNPESWVLESGIQLLNPESWVLESGIQLKESGILGFGIRNTA